LPLPTCHERGVQQLKDTTGPALCMSGYTDGTGNMIDI
jgi:hypothetical protein